MTPHPPIFVSGVSKELHSARDLVAKTLQFLGYRPVWQDLFGAEQGDLRAVLRAKIDGCKGVVQLVGWSYGAEPSALDEHFGRVSYTQYEALYARQRNKKVWYLVLDEHFPCDPYEAETEELRRLQTEYRKRVQSDPHLYHPLSSSEALKARVLEIKDELANLRRGFRRLTLGASAILVTILALVIFLVIGEYRRPYDKWVWDRFIGVCVSEPTAGTLLGEKPYEVSLQIKNRTSMPMIITRITVLSRNEDAARLMGVDDPQVFKGEIHVAHFLNGNESTTIPVKLNQVLPKELTTRLYHNQSDIPSEFKIKLGGTALPMPTPRHLNSKLVFAGQDSLAALQAAAREARRWSADAKIMASFPGDSAVLLDQESRLKYTVVETWITSFYSAGRKRMFVAVVSAIEAKGQEVSETPDPKVVLDADAPDPVLGYQQALDLANRANLLSGDWQSPCLGALRVQGDPVRAWFLPYRAPSGLPIIVDATTGDLLLPVPGDEFRRAPLRSASLAH